MRNVQLDGKDAITITIEFNNCYRDVLELMRRDIILKFNPLKVDIELYSKENKKLAK